MRWLLPLLLGVLAACAHAETAPTAPRSPEKRIALSFDDAPRAPGAFLTEEERTRLLIANLAEAGVDQAVFFVNPGQIDGADDEARIVAYVAAGHVIANHSASPPHLSQTDAAAYLADIDAAEEWLHGRAGYRPWFRYPYLDEGRQDKGKRDAVREGLAQRGLSNGYVTIDASDWFYESAAKRATVYRIPTMASLDGNTVEMSTEQAAFAENAVAYTATLNFLRGRVETVTRAIRGE